MVLTLLRRQILLILRCACSSWRLCSTRRLALATPLALHLHTTLEIILILLPPLPRLLRLLPLAQCLLLLARLLLLLLRALTLVHTNQAHIALVHLRWLVRDVECRRIEVLELRVVEFFELGLSVRDVAGTVARELVFHVVCLLLHRSHSFRRLFVLESVYVCCWIGDGCVRLVFLFDARLEWVVGVG